MFYVINLEPVGRLSFLVLVDYLADGDGITGFDLMGRDVDPPTIEQDVPVRHDLARLEVGKGEARPKDNIVEPRFKQHGERIGTCLGPVDGSINHPTKLPFAQVVKKLSLLFFHKL